jgi:hypothetical protein
VLSLSKYAPLLVNRKFRYFFAQWNYLFLFFSRAEQ